MESIVGKLTNRKIPEKDNLPAELVKFGGMRTITAIHKIIQQIWIEEILPKDWEEGVICPIYKKGDKFECGNYRGITLLNVAYKILSITIKNRLEPYIEQILGEYQAGFRRNRSTLDQLFTVRQTLRRWEFGIDVFQLFIDFKQAYDSIDKESLHSVMLNLGIPPKLVGLTKIILDQSICVINIQGSLGTPFECGRGLKQGDGLALMLFNLALEGVVRQVGVDPNGNLTHNSKQLAGFADDINCLARSLHGLQGTYVELDKAAETIGLQINEDKTKVLVITRRTRRPELNIPFASRSFEEVLEFKYLGSILTADE